MNAPVGWLILALVTVSVLASAGPTIVALTRALVPLVIAVGSVVIVSRIAWHITRRY